MNSLPAGSSARSQRERMLAGELYDASDPELAQRRARARELTARYNTAQPREVELRSRLLRELLGRCGETILIEPPFHCDYGENIELGENVFLNFGCVLLDCARIRIGSYVQIAPYVQLLAAYHPLDARERIKGPELAAPITIGDNVWLGGGVIVCPGVSIGESTTIGAGSVVTRNIPAGVLAFGNPCRVIRSLQ